VIDGQEHCVARQLSKRVIPCRHGVRGNTKVHEVGRTEKIGVTLKGRNFAPWYQQEFVEKGLEFPYFTDVGSRVGDGQKVEAAARRGLGGQVERARNFLAGLTLTAAVTVCGVCVQVASIPASIGLEGRPEDAGLRGHGAGSPKINVRGDFRFGFRPNVGDRDQEFPQSRRASRKQWHQTRRR
jgi:hypothetical protein